MTRIADRTSRRRSACASLIAAVRSAAQSTLPPPDVAQTPRLPPAQRADGRGRHRRHRLAHPPRPAVAGRADRLRRPGRHRQDRPQLDQRRAPAPAELGRRPQQQVQQFGQPRQSAGRRRRRRRRGRNRPALPGSRRMLVLVDGLRYVNGASASGVPGSTDLNSIPESMIERIEVLQDGASAIYGSDAIAGVVNIITKKRQEGFLACAQLGGYRRRRRLHPELPAELGQWRRRPAAGRRRRQLCEAELGLVRATARSRASRRPMRQPAPTAAARASSPNGRFAGSAWDSSAATRP